MFDEDTTKNKAKADTSKKKVLIDGHRADSLLIRMEQLKKMLEEKQKTLQR